MFCQECGSKLEDGAKFCQKCGVKILSTDAGNDTPVSPADEKNDAYIGETKKAQRTISSVPDQNMQPQIKNVSEGVSGKNKSKRKFVLLGIIAVVSIIIFIVMNWNGKIDYISTVGEHRPFDSSQNLPYTYEEVLNQYIVSPKWEVRQEGNAHFVDISGTIKGIDCRLIVTIKVLSDPDDSERALIKPEFIMIDDEKSPTQNDAVEFLLIIFMAYDEGYEDLAGLLLENEQPETQGQISESIENYYELSGTYKGSKEQSELSLSIYSSQEEGEVAIGNAEIYVSGGIYYSGEIIPIEKDVYMVEVDTGEEILLATSVSADNIVIQLYIDGQSVEEYWMEEHYEA